MRPKQRRPVLFAQVIMSRSFQVPFVRLLPRRRRPLLLLAQRGEGLRGRLRRLVVAHGLAGILQR